MTKLNSNNQIESIQFHMGEIEGERERKRRLISQSQNLNTRDDCCSTKKRATHGISEITKSVRKKLVNDEKHFSTHRMHSRLCVFRFIVHATSDTLYRDAHTHMTWLCLFVSLSLNAESQHAGTVNGCLNLNE